MRHSVHLADGFYQSTLRTGVDAERLVRDKGSISAILDSLVPLDALVPPRYSPPYSTPVALPPRTLLPPASLLA